MFYARGISSKALLNVIEGVSTPCKLHRLYGHRYTLHVDIYSLMAIHEGYKFNIWVGCS